MALYSILTNVPTEHARQLYLAECEDFPGRFDFNMALVRGEQPAPPAPVLPLRLDLTGPRLDFLPIINLRADLCSARFIEVLTRLEVPFLAYPAQVRDIRTGEVLSDPYQVWRPVAIANAIDWDRCKYAMHPIFHRQELCELVLSETCLQALPPLFQAPRYSEWLIRDDIGRDLVAAGMTGLEFYPLTMPVYQRTQPGRLIEGQATPPSVEE